MSKEKTTVASAAGGGQKPGLQEKKAWFRKRRPNGGMVLNPLRVTDQMAIFEARLFADKNDRNPIASFTATCAAGKAIGGQYIRTAQDEALNEALDNAGFGLELPEPVLAATADTPPAPAEEPVSAPVQEVQPVPKKATVPTVVSIAARQSGSRRSRPKRRCQPRLNPPPNPKKAPTTRRT